MDSIKHSIAQLTEHFNSKMAEFQQNLNSNMPAASPTSDIVSQFNAFRSFVLTALEGLQLQVELLSKKCDQMEMRSRRKMLLVHGVPEAKKENLSAYVSQLLSEHLKLPELSVDSISRCHRLGSSAPEKPRVILIKFQDPIIRNKVWYAKTNLKNTGVTLSEFLTKERHDVFVAARQRLGINKCWTRDGSIVIIGPDGKRHQITSMAELNTYSTATVSQQVSARTATSSNTNTQENKNSQGVRPKRNLKK
ncbi:uncharacterized protein LOC124542442 [Vanessa cardui]|uniref:uncharacterized protein LOC124542442 n=1 Tax=Vanessa cardui TaxID=171605 RepID=UPI001F13AA24|nr:uncharacterized protein LOC124542442 [Vanessa cardui]